jgi:hypothetical protein
MILKFRRVQNEALFLLNFKTYTASQADIIRAGRDKPPIHPVMAKVALLGDIPVHVICDSVVRAFLNAGLTPRTHIVVHNDDTVPSFDDGFYRTGLGTRWFVAVPAQVDLEYKLRSIIDPSRPVFVHRNQFDALCRPVFLLAGHLAGSATPAERFLNVKFKLRHVMFLRLHRKIL